MDVSLPSYEAAMRDASAFLRRRDMSSHEEIPLYFAWERLYAAANANLSVDFVHESRAELRARKQARLAPRRGLPPPLFTSFDKLNRSSTQASAFLRSATPSAAAIDMMARRYRRDAKKLRSSRLKSVDSPPSSPVKSVETRSKRSKQRQKGRDAPVRDLQEALEHARASVKGGFDDILRLNEADRVAAKMVATRPSSRAKSVYLASPELSPVAKVAVFAAQVSDWDAASNLVALTSSAVKGKGGDLEKQSTRRATPMENGEGDTTFDTSPESSLLEGEDDAADEQKEAMKVDGIGTFQALNGDEGGSENKLNESEVSKARRRSRQQSTDSTDRSSRADRSEERRRSRLSSSGEPNEEEGRRRRPSVIVEDDVDEGVSEDENSIGQTADRGVEPQRKEKQSVSGDRASSSHNQRESQSGTTLGSELKRKAETGVGDDGVVGAPQTTQRQQQQSVEAQLEPLIGSNTASAAAKPGQNSGFSGRLSSSHAVGDMQVKVEGRKIVVTFEGALDASTEEEEDMADHRLRSAVRSPSGIFEAEQQQPVTRTVDSIMRHAEEEEVPPDSQRWSQVRNQVRGKELRKHRTEVLIAAVNGHSNAGESGERMVNESKSRPASQSERRESRVPAVERDAENREPRSEPQRQQEGTRRNASNERHATSVDGEVQESRALMSKASVRDDSVEEFEEEERKSVFQAVNTAREGSDNEEEAAEESPRGSQRWSQVRKHVRGKELRTHRDPTAASRDHGFGENGIHFVEDRTIFQSERLESRDPTGERGGLDQEERSESNRSDESRSSRGGAASQDAIRDRHRDAKVDGTAFEEEVEARAHARAPVRQMKPDPQQQPVSQGTRWDARNDHHASRAEGESQESRAHRTKVRARGDSAEEFEEEEQSVPQGVSNAREDSAVDEEEADGSPRGSQRWSQVRNHVQSQGLPKSRRPNSEAERRVPTTERDVKERDARSESNRSRESRGSRVGGASRHLSTKTDRFEVEADGHRSRFLQQPQDRVPVDEREEEQQQPSKKRQPRVETIDKDPQAQDARAPRSSRSRSESAYSNAHASMSNKPQVEEILDDFDSEGEQSDDLANGLATKEKQRGSDQNDDSYSDYESPGDREKATRHSKRFDRGMYRELKTQRPESVPAMKYPPEKDQGIHEKEQRRRSKRESAGSGYVKPPKELLEGIVWPPGMEDECIARLGLDGHHPMAPPGLEHLQAIMLVLIADIMSMAMETMDGPRFGGTEPAYNY
ncbi:hypothetical protein BBJ28_00019528, partial [Nothophytophthora sp. Chile5]